MKHPVPCFLRSWAQRTQRSATKAATSCQQPQTCPGATSSRCVSSQAVIHLGRVVEPLETVVCQPRRPTTAHCRKGHGVTWHKEDQGRMADLAYQVGGPDGGTPVHAVQTGVECRSPHGHRAQLNPSVPALPATQLREAQRRQGELEAALASKEAECAGLREVVEACADVQSRDVQAAKIIELSKKVGMHVVWWWRTGGSTCTHMCRAHSLQATQQLGA